MFFCFFEKKTTDIEEAALTLCVCGKRNDNLTAVCRLVRRPLTAPRFSGVREATLQPARSAADTRTSRPCCRSTTSGVALGDLCDRDRSL